ncbi:unnamed protein product, partial [Ixodes pacificus]
ICRHRRGDKYSTGTTTDLTIIPELPCGQASSPRTFPSRRVRTNQAPTAAGRPIAWADCLLHLALESPGHTVNPRQARDCRQIGIHASPPSSPCWGRSHRRQDRSHGASVRAVCHRHHAPGDGHLAAGPTWPSC